MEDIIKALESEISKYESKEVIEDEIELHTYYIGIIKGLKIAKGIIEASKDEDLKGWLKKTYD